MDINLNDYEEFMVADYAPLNKSYTLTITGASVANSYDRKQRKEIQVPALHFRETKKKLKLTSNENRHTLARLYGPLSSEWIGKPINVRVIEKSNFGETRRIFELSAPTLTPAHQGDPTKVATLVVGQSPELGQMLDLAAALGEKNPSAAVEATFHECNDDMIAALEVFKTRYAERVSAGTGR